MEIDNDNYQNTRRPASPDSTFASTSTSTPPPAIEKCSKPLYRVRPAYNMQLMADKSPTSIVVVLLPL